MGRVNQYILQKDGVGVIVKGQTRISCFARSGISILEQPYIMSYLSDLQSALASNQFWRSNPMMADDTSISRLNTDYIFPKEGALLYFFVDVFQDVGKDAIIEIHTEIDELGDGF